MANTEILYIEDNFHNRRIVRKILERQGYTLHECEDGLEGYEMLKAMKPGIVLLDISLPSMDGMEIAGLVKADPELEHIYLIALTASAMQGDRERFLDGGCDDYLSKPFRALDLVDLVGKYMDLVKGDISTPPPLPSEIHNERLDVATAEPAVEVVEAAPAASPAVEAPPEAPVITEEPVAQMVESLPEIEPTITENALPTEIMENDDLPVDDTAELTQPPEEPESVWQVESEDEVVEQPVVDEVAEIEERVEQPAVEEAEVPAVSVIEEAAEIEEPVEQPAVEEAEIPAVSMVEETAEIEELVELPVIEEVEMAVEHAEKEISVVEESVVVEPEITELEFSPEKGKKAIANLIKAGIADAINQENLKPAEPNA